MALALLVYKALCRVDGEADDDESDEADGAASEGVLAMFPKFLQPAAASGRICPLLRPKQIEALTEPLKLATATFPRLHMAWRLVLDGVLPESESDGAAAEGEDEEEEHEEEEEEEGSEREGLASLAKLWDGCVDGPLVNGSHQMKGVALVLLSEASVNPKSRSE